MTWMKAGEFECENGCKAVVVGRLPNPANGTYVWFGYAELKDSGKSVLMSWTDDGTSGTNGGFNIKPPTQVRYMAVSLLGGLSGWSHSLKAAVTNVKDATFVLAVDFVHGKIVNAQIIRVYIPNGHNAWKQMGLGELFITTILNPSSAWSVESKVEEACDCGYTPKA